jgi:hypothetical protein
LGVEEEAALPTKPAGRPTLARLPHGVRILVVGDRGWRLIWRVSSDEAGAIVINVAEVWAMGARSESEVYQEAHHHVATLPRSPLTVTLTDVIKRLGTIGDDAGQLRAAAKPGSGRRQRGLIRWGATGLGNGANPAGRRVRSHRSPTVRPASPPTCAELEGEWSGRHHRASARPGPLGPAQTQPWHLPALALVAGRQRDPLDQSGGSGAAGRLGLAAGGRCRRGRRAAAVGRETGGCLEQPPAHLWPRAGEGPLRCGLRW